MRAHFFDGVIREFGDDEFEDLLQHKKMILFFQHFEGLFEIVKENFRDFWRTIFEISEDNRLHSSIDRIGSIKNISKLNLRISNILNSYKAYENHLSHHLSTSFGANQQYRDYFDEIKSWWYDNLFEYRFCVRLRNYIQHFSTPIDKISYPCFLLRIDQQGAFAYTVSAEIYKRKLLEYDGWSIVKNDITSLQEDIDLFPVFQLFYNSLMDIHSKMRIRMGQLYRDSKNFTKKLHSECTEYIKSHKQSYSPMPNIVINYDDGSIANIWIPCDMIKGVDYFRSQNANSKSRGYEFTTLQASKHIKKIQDVVLKD